MSLDVVTQGDQLLVGELVDPNVAGYPGRLQSLAGPGLTDAEDVGKCDLETLVAREIDTDQTCHLAVCLSDIRSWRQRRPVVDREGAGRDAFPARGASAFARGFAGAVRP